MHRHLHNVAYAAYSEAPVAKQGFHSGAPGSTQNRKHAPSVQLFIEQLSILNTYSKIFSPTFFPLIDLLRSKSEGQT